MNELLTAMQKFHTEYFPFRIDNKVEEIESKNGLTTIHGWYNNKPFVASLDSSVNYMELLDGDFEQEEEILDWLTSIGI